MKILIIGGTGTISSAITRQLAAEGHDLWCDRVIETLENSKKYLL